MEQPDQCPLCFHPLTNWKSIADQQFLECTHCKAICRAPQDYLSAKAEKSRYHLHQNDVNDNGFQNFVKPLVHDIEQRHSFNQLGLDYGCGPEPVITKLLTDQGFRIKLYDPFFYKANKHLLFSYNYIITCEVIEHFYQPEKEFKLLHHLLFPGGSLYCKTNFLTPERKADFENWWYKNDPTHVFFYAKETLLYIQKAFNFSQLVHKPNYCIFIK